jgi:hypothetical protein
VVFDLKTGDCKDDTWLGCGYRHWECSKCLEGKRLLFVVCYLLFVNCVFQYTLPRTLPPLRCHHLDASPLTHLFLFFRRRPKVRYFLLSQNV